MTDDLEPCVSVTIDPNNNKLNLDGLERICTIGKSIVNYSLAVK